MALREPVVPAPLVPVVRAQVLVLAQVRPHPQLPVLAQHPRESELLAPVQLPVVLVVLVHLVVEPAVPVEPLLSRQSFSAAMAGSTPKTRATYEPVPKSR